MDNTCPRAAFLSQEDPRCQVMEHVRGKNVYLLFLHQSCMDQNFPSGPGQYEALWEINGQYYHLFNRVVLDGIFAMCDRGLHAEAYGVGRYDRRSSSLQMMSSACSDALICSNSAMPSSHLDITHQRDISHCPTHPPIKEHD